MGMTIMDYLKWRGDIEISYDGFRNIDNILLSTMCYADLSGIVPREEEGSVTLDDAAQMYRVFGRKESEKSTLKKGETALLGMAGTKRFGNIRLSDYTDIVDDESGVQFSAVKIHLQEESCYIAFRGTDDNLVGWREDFEMCYRVSGAQRMACEYLNRHIREGTYRIGGHSKGGNLAVYAAMNCESAQQGRILCIYSNDGLGICADMMDDEKYRRIEGRIIRTVPYYSIIGILFPNGEPDYIVVADGGMMEQHNPLNWHIGDGDLETVDSVAAQCRDFSRVFNEWLKNLSPVQKKSLTDEFFDILKNSGKKKLTDIPDGFLEELGEFIDMAKGMTKESRQMVNALFKGITYGMVNRTKI